MLITLETNNILGFQNLKIISIEHVLLVKDDLKTYNH